MDKNIVHEIGNYLQQIIGNAEYITKCDELSAYSEKIKCAAYKIDALITDNTKKTENLKIKTNQIEGIDFSKLAGLNVLIVDDMLENIQIMENIFTTLSTHVISAMSGEEALEIYKKGFHPDIVCMDMMMPGIDGTTTTKELRNLGSEAYFIAISALKNQTNDVVSVFDCWLPKPFTLEHIKGALSAYNTFSYKTEELYEYKLDDAISKETKELLLEFAEDRAYTKLEKLIGNLEESDSKEFLLKSLLQVDFKSISKSILSS